MCFLYLVNWTERSSVSCLSQPLQPLCSSSLWSYRVCCSVVVFFVFRFSTLEPDIKSGMETSGIEDSKRIFLLVSLVTLSLFPTGVLTTQQYTPTWLEAHTSEDSLLCFHTRPQLPSVVLPQWPTS